MSRYVGEPDLSVGVGGSNTAAPLPLRKPGISTAIRNLLVGFGVLVGFGLGFLLGHANGYNAGADHQYNRDHANITKSTCHTVNNGSSVTATC